MILLLSCPSHTNLCQPILRKLRERAHAALAMSHPQNSDVSARLSSSSGPQIKTETDELLALGGMTRLVERISSSSSSYSGSSPGSQSVSPQPASQAQDSHHSFSEAANTWQNYGPVQPQNYPDQYHMQHAHTQIDTSMMYSGQQQGTPMQAMPDYYGYSPQSGYGVAQSPDITPAPNHYLLPADSWQNFMAQFKH
jgi:hypothetical protein